MLRLVHVSDIHFRHGPGWDLDADQRDQLVVDLASLVEVEGQGIDGILVGGDVAFKGERTQYEDALGWLRRLIDVSGCPSGGVWMVPGNHDVDWSIVDTSSIIKGFHREVREADLDVLDQLLNERMAIDAAGAGLIEPFREYNHFAREWGCETAAVEPEWYDPLGSMDGTPVKLCGLNSAFISDSNDAQDEKIPNLVLGGHQCKVKEEHGEIRIVLCHHPPKWLRDWDRVAAYFERAHLLLFGHEHDFRCEQQGERGQVWIHAGAVIPEAGGNRAATYNLLRLGLDGDDLGLTVQSRVWSEESKRFISGTGDPETFTIACDLRTLGEMEKPSRVEGKKEEPMAATPLAPRIGKEPEVSIDQQARLREIAVAYMSAPATTRIEIARRLGVLENADLELLTDRERYGTILARIRDKGLTDRLAEELAK